MKGSSRRISQRRGNRFEARGETAVTVFFHDERIEGRLLDESSKGFGVVVAAGTQLRKKQRVRLVIHRRMFLVQVVDIRDVDDGVRLGLKTE